MNNTAISFPGLGLTLDPPSYIQLGPLTIHFYGVIIAVGLVLAVVYGMRRQQQFGFRGDAVLDGVLCVVPFAIICARLYYCAFAWDTYADNPIEILYIWQGGLAIYGGVIGAALGILVYTKVKKINLLALLDLVSIGFLIGQSIGRWGNFMNREAYGAVTDSFLRMGLYLTESGRYSSQMQYFHPTFLYESLWNAAGFVILHFGSKKRRYDGQIALGYVAWYGLGRTFIEGLRTDSLYLGPFRISQLLAAVTCAAAVIVLVIQHFRSHDPANLYANRVAAAEAAAALGELQPEEEFLPEEETQPEEIPQPEEETEETEE